MKHYMINDLEKVNLDTIPFIPTICVGFYISGEEETLQKECRKLKKKFLDIDVVACSVESNIQSTFPHLHPSQIQFVCFDMRKDAYHISYVHHDNPEFSLKEGHSYNALVFSVYENRKIENFIESLKDRIGERNIYGAIAASPSKDIETSLFYNSKIFTKEDASLVWFIDSAYYDVQGVSIHTFIPVGTELSISKFQEKTVFEIENNPALEVIEDTIGELDNEGILRFEYPFFIKNKKEKSTLLLASIQSIDREEKSIELFRELQTDSKITLSIPMLREIQDEHIKQHIQTKFNSGFSFLFSCIAFKSQWEELETLYIMLIAKQLKNNFIGSHTFGEIGPLSNCSSSNLQNQTLTLINIDEKVAPHA